MGYIPAPWIFMGQPDPNPFMLAWDGRITWAEALRRDKRQRNLPPKTIAPVPPRAAQQQGRLPPRPHVTPGPQQAAQRPVTPRNHAT